MADQKKWFKVWASILIDPHMSGLSLADMGRWVRLGAYVVTSGERGKLVVPNPSPGFLLAMEVESLADAKMLLKRLPNVQIKDTKDDNGSFIVIMLNWFKYQVDSTAYERVKRSRSKRRGEERRGEEKRRNTPQPPKGGFDQIWARYPRREGRKGAERQFNASVKTPQDWLDIQNAIDNYLAQLRANHTSLEYTKMGSTWFNNWRDYVNYKVVKDSVARTSTPSSQPSEMEQPPPKMSETDLQEIHDIKVAKLGPCRAKDCRYCKKTAEVAQ